MKALKADRYSIGSSNNGRTKVIFRDGNDDGVEIDFPTFGIMALAMSLRKIAKEAPVPMILAKPAQFRKIAGPPSHPTLKAGSEPGPETEKPPHISIGVTADLEAVWTLIVARNKG